MRQIGRTERLHLWLNYGVGHAVRQFEETCRRFPDLSEALELARHRRTAAFSFLPARAVERLTAAAVDGFLDAWIERLDGMDVDVVMPMHANYPPLLKQIFDPPSVLYVKGSLALLPHVTIAVVGTRTPSDYGKRMAETFSYALAGAGACVVSGLAAGVDTYAAHGALATPGAACPTVAVLGSGIDVVYPRGNERLFAEIAEHGAVITEYLPGEAPLREHFPVRNRIVSGMSHGVLVVEAAERSGTSITVGCAHEQGREVFAIPARITDIMSVGTNRLIQSGAAKPVFAVEDILCEFFHTTAAAGGIPAAQEIALSSLSNEQRQVYAALKMGERSFDELFEMLGFGAGLLNSTLTAMQFSGIIKQLPGRVYAADTLRTVVRGDELAEE